MNLEMIMGKIIRAIVGIAAVVVIAGGTLYLIRHGQELPQYRVFRGAPDHLNGVHGAIASARSLDARGIMQLGILLLITVPLLRVVAAGAGFIQARDRLYAGMTIAVGAILLYSLLGSGF
jgi:uncharacterized membrane protein